MRFGLVTARASAEWHVRRLTSALRALGEVERVDPSELRVVCGREAGSDRLEVIAAGHDAGRFDAVLLGHVVGPGADEDLQLDAARALEWTGVPCLNRVEPMLAAQDKLRTAMLLARAGVPTPLCTSVPTRGAAPVALGAVGPGVAKPLFGSLGEGLFRCEGPRAARRLARAATSGPHLLQRWVEAGAVDFRLFVVSGRVEACIRREAVPGEWRANFARGAAVIEFPASRALRDIAIEATKALGLEYAGVDVAVGSDGPCVLEVNGFPSFRGVHAATGRDMARPIAQAASRLARTNRLARRPRRLRA